MCGIALIQGRHADRIELMHPAIRDRGVVSERYVNKDLSVLFTHLPITNTVNPQGSYQVNQTRVWMNGYISNYRELSEQYSLRPSSGCDTEFLAMFIDRYGYAKLKELNGFFSVIAYNTETGGIKAFTDRYGIKQLYKHTSEGTTYYCSVPEGILGALGYAVKFNQPMVDDWHYSLGTMGNTTIYEGIDRVTPIHFSPIRDTIDISYDKAKTMLYALWRQSIKRNQSLNHTTGVFLSGGVDSGAIAHSIEPDFCFSMDYMDGRSELDLIKLNSNGTHCTMICNDAMRDVYAPMAAGVLDDPSAGSCYTNYALMDMASKFCTVLYSGAGADELFMGYDHRYSRDIDQVIRRDDAMELRHYPHVLHRQYDWMYLRGILRVEDRIGGAHTVETRYPFLDNDLVDFVLSLPLDYIRGKRIFKEISGLHPDVLSGKKRGWTNPHFSNAEWTNYVIDDIYNRHIQRFRPLR